MKKETNNIWFADFETDGDIVNGAYVYLGYIENLKDNRNCLFVSIDEMIEYLVSQKERKTHTVYFHNLSWDGEFILWWLINNNFEPQLTKVSKNYQFRERTDFLGKRGEIYIMYKSIKIFFLCTYKIWPFKAAKIGESLGMEKLNIEHNIGRKYDSINQVPEDVKEYVKRDVQIIKQKYIEYSKNYVIKKTASSSSWHNFKQWYKLNNDKSKFKNKYSFDKTSFKKLYTAYWGGLTIINDKHVNKLLEGKIGYYDINSSYPSAFTENLMPYGQMLKKKPEGDYVCIVEAVIYDVKKKDERMCDHLHNWVAYGNKRDTYIKNYEGVMNVMYVSDEWEQIKLSYDFKIVNINYIYFKASRELGDYINQLYIKKENATNAVDRSDHKLILNSFYGKWGQNYLQSRRDLYLADETEYRKYHYGDYVYRVVTDEKTDVKYLPIAIFTTAYSRVKLLKAVRANIDNWIYGDTDSLVIFGDKINGVKIDDRKLGYWKKEAEVNKFKVIKTKCYIMELSDGTLKRKITGLSDVGKDKINFDNFYAGNVIEGGNRKKKKLKGGYVLIDEDTTL